MPRWDPRKVVPTPWMADAACYGKDTRLWFPERGESGAEAIAICRACPVRIDCLDHAMTHRETRGIWGGLSDKQRRRVRRVRAQSRREAGEAQQYQRPAAGPTKGHGTDARYRAHLRRGETPCPACTAAHNEICRMQKASKRVAS